MSQSSIGERRENVSLTRLEPKHEVKSEGDGVEHVPPNVVRGAVYADTGKGDTYKGWSLRYGRESLPRQLSSKRRKAGVVAAELDTFDRPYGLSSYVPEPRVVKPISASELEWESQYREFKLWRMITSSDLPQAQKESLLFQVFPWAESAYSQARVESASRKFYSELGYPQFGGKYAPFSVPSGAKIKSVLETEAGLKIEYEFAGETKLSPHERFEESAIGTSPRLGAITYVPSEESKKIVDEDWISEQLYDVQVGKELALTSQGPVLQPLRPLAPLAFLVAPAEWFAYGLVSMLRGSGAEAVSTPPSTPTLFTDTLGVVRAGRTAMAASLLGEIMLSQAIGFFSIPVVEGASNVVQTFGSGAKATGHLMKDYFVGTQTFKDLQLAGRGLAEGLIGEEPYMYVKNVLAPNVKNVYGPEIASTIRNQLAVLQGVPREAIKDVPFAEEAIQYHSGVMFKEPLTSMVGSAILTEDAKLAARGLAEGFIGSERYSYIKSVASPMIREIYVPEASQKVSTFFAVLHGVPAEIIKEIPKPLETWRMYHSGVLFNEPFLAIAFPHVAKPQELMFLKSVFAPNIGQYYSFKMPSLTLDSEAWSFLTEPVKTAKAYGKVAAGKIRYDLGLHVSPSEFPFEHTPLVFDAPKETGKRATQYVPETSQVAIQVKPEESLSVTGMPKTFLAPPFLRQSQREEEYEPEVLSYPKSFSGKVSNVATVGVSQIKGFDLTVPIAKVGLFQGVKSTPKMVPAFKAKGGLFSGVKLKSMSLSDSSFRLDSGLKQSMKQAQNVAEQYKMKQQLKIPEAFQRPKGKKRKPKKARGSKTDWYKVDWPLSKPEDFLEKF